MKSIIGQSNINNRGVGGTGSGTKNLANITATIGMNMLGDMNSIMNSPQLSLEGLDLLNSNTNWDLLGTDNPIQGEFNINAALSGSANMNSGDSSWDNMTQLKVGQPTLPHQSQAAGIPQVQGLSAMAKRQATFQQQRSQSVSFDERKNPRFSPSPGSRGTPYPLQSQRSVPSMMGYVNQRSPVAASVGAAVPPSRSPGGQFTAPYPQQRKTVSPMMSPQPGEN